MKLTRTHYIIIGVIIILVILYFVFKKKKTSTTTLTGTATMAKGGKIGEGGGKSIVPARQGEVPTILPVVPTLIPYFGRVVNGVAVDLPNLLKGQIVGDHIVACGGTYTTIGGASAVCGCGAGQNGCLVAS